MQGMPVIRIELEGMKFAMLTALNRHQAEMDEMINMAVEKACQPEVIQKKLDVMASEAIESSIKKEINSFYRYGEGRKIIKKLIAENWQKPKNTKPCTPTYGLAQS